MRGAIWLVLLFAAATVAALTLGDNKGLEAVRDVIEAFGRPAIHLVLNAAYEMPLLLEQVRFFSKAGISDLVLTHLDEELRWGKAWNFLFGTNYGIRFLASGQNIPGDLLSGTAELVLSRQFGGKAA